MFAASSQATVPVAGGADDAAADDAGTVTADPMRVAEATGANGTHRYAARVCKAQWVLKFTHMVVEA